MNDGAFRQGVPGAGLPDAGAAAAVAPGMPMAPAAALAPARRESGWPRDGGLRSLPFDVLRHAAAGEREAALAALDQLFAMRGRFPAYPLLLDMALGRQAWRQCGPLFVLGEGDVPPAIARQLDEAIAECSRFLGVPAPCIVLQLRAGTRDLHLTMESFPGLAVLRLSTLSPAYPDGLRATLFHEVAHCFMTCGVRLLDEGWAHFFASRLAGATLAPARTELLPPTRVLLSGAADAMFGDGADSNPDAYLAACRVGADVLEAVHARGGAEGIVRLFAAVARAAGDAHIVRLVEHASGVVLSVAGPVAAADPGVSAAPGVPHGEAGKGGDHALVAAARDAIFSAWIRKEPGQLDQPIAALDQCPLHQAPELLDSAIGARLNRALLQATYGVPPPAAQLAQLDLLMQSAGCLPQGRMLLWRGARAMLAILLARPNIIKVALAGQQAFDAFNKAAQLIPADPDLLVQHAALLLHAPANHGGDRDLGVSKLRQAMEHPVYREHARQVLLEYGIETPAMDSAAGALPGASARDGAPGAADAAHAACTALADAAAPVHVAVEAAAPAAAASPLADRPPAVAAAPAVLALRGVVVPLSPAFTLRPGDFTLGRGERVALVGRNGSGKSMLLETVLGLRLPGEGTVRLQFGAGSDNDAALRQHIGGLLQGYDMPGQTRVSDMMALHRAMYRRSDPAVGLALGMEELRALYWKHLSRGQKQRVMLWMALAHAPQLAVLDEPSLGLDEWFARQLRALLAALPMTVLMISHAPADLLAMDRIVCMEHGRIVAEGALATLMAERVGSHKGRVRGPLSDAARLALGALPGLVQPPRRQGDGWEVFGGEGFDHVFRRFIEQQHIGSFSLEPVSVEDFLADATHSGACP